MVHVDRVQIHVMQDLQVDTQHDHVDETLPGHVSEPTDDPMRAVHLRMRRVRFLHVQAVHMLHLAEHVIVLHLAVQQYGDLAHIPMIQTFVELQNTRECQFLEM